MCNRWRIGENFTQLQSWYADCGLQYNLHKHWILSIHYVYTPSRLRDQKFSVFHQYYAAIQCKQKLTQKISLSNRIIVQRTAAGVWLDAGNPDKNSIALREKIACKQKIKAGYSIFVANEWMWDLLAYPLHWQRNRTYIGCNKNLHKRVDIDAYFVWQQSRNNLHAQYFIYGLDLNYQLHKIK